ncbi:hypothetical protein [Psychroserpens jangbogonensis]|uniref:hypothetical protein n=1 Tax=Psychroserpens jangbogonensis TaxID=1484460 RepID=UPI00053D8783|nr:hypothetical protein [Psychroserpens jangbogonensis]
MKANLSPKLIHDIDEDAVLLWFEKANRYVVTSRINSDFIKLYMNPDESRDSFVNNLSKDFDLNSSEANTMFNDISRFLKDVNIDTDIDTISNKVQVAPTSFIEEYYQFIDKVVCIRFESDIIKSLVHPQIAHHSIKSTVEYDVLFDVFRLNDDLHLLKNGVHVGSYKTKAFHFLQGKFALELTNTIHDTNISNWVATFHASTISNGKESIMIIGDSGNGKSTLSVLLMAHGFDILSDDFTPLYEDNLHLYRYPAATSIKKGAFEALKPYLNGIDLLKTHHNGPKKVNIKYVPPILSYESQPASFPCKKIVYVKYDSSKSDSLNLVSPEKILETLIPDSWISPKEKHALKFINWFKEVDCYQLNYNSNDFAITKFKDLFEES